MTVHFAALDWLVVGLFLAGVLALGFSARLRQNSILQFLAAGRALTLPMFVATLVSTWYGGILGVGESISTYGVGSWLLLGLPYYVFALIYALYFARRVRAEDQLSLPERLALKWGKGAGLVGAGLVLLLAVPAAQVYMLGVLIQVFTGWTMLPCLILGGVTVAAFLLKGGLLADVRVGMLGFVLMYVGFIAIDLYCLASHPVGTIIPTLRQQDHLKFDGGIGPVGVFSFFILGAWTLVDPGFHQRVTSSASPEVGRKGVLISILFWMLFDLLSMTAGLYAVALLPKLPDDLVAIFPIFGDQILPPGLKGLFFIGMAGTIVSALAGYTLVSGATVGREIIARLKPEMTDAGATAWSRVGLFVGCAIAIVVALSVHSVVDIWYSYSGAIVGALLIPISVAYLVKGRVGIGPVAVWTSMAASFLAAILWMAQGLRTENPYLNVHWLGETFSLGTLAPALAVSGIILGVAALLKRRTAGDT